MYVNTPEIVPLAHVPESRFAQLRIVWCAISMSGPIAVTVAERAILMRSASIAAPEKSQHAPQ